MFASHSRPAAFFSVVTPFEKRHVLVMFYNCLSIVGQHLTIVGQYLRISVKMSPAI